MSPEPLSAEQVERYQAHLSLPGLGPEGQQRLLGASVLMVRVGGLGCPAAQYLVAAGVGSVTLVDDDRVDGTNLQRQILFGDRDRGELKVVAAAARLRELNGGIAIVPSHVRIVAGNVRELVRGHDVVVDGSDNFATRYVVNDACVLEAVPLVSGSIYQYEGQVMAMVPPETPCYRCVFRSPPQEAAACREVGVLGPLAGLVGAVMAAEAVKLLAMGSTALLGRMQLIDVQAMTFRQVHLRRDQTCPLCGDTPSILEPTALAHGAFPRD